MKLFMFDLGRLGLACRYPSFGDMTTTILSLTVYLTLVVLMYQFDVCIC
jgi:hypothetical protein